MKFHDNMLWYESIPPQFILCVTSIAYLLDLLASNFLMCSLLPSLFLFAIVSGGFPQLRKPPPPWLRDSTNKMAHPSAPVPNEKPGAFQGQRGGWRQCPRAGEPSFPLAGRATHKRQREPREGGALGHPLPTNHGWGRGEPIGGGGGTTKRAVNPSWLMPCQESTELWPWSLPVRMFLCLIPLESPDRSIGALPFLQDWPENHRGHPGWWLWGKPGVTNPLGCCRLDGGTAQILPTPPNTHTEGQGRWLL